LTVVRGLEMQIDDYNEGARKVNETLQGITADLGYIAEHEHREQTEGEHIITEEATEITQHKADDAV